MNVKHIIIFTVIVLLTAVFGFAGPKSDDVYFAAHPSISPDAQKIVFSYEGDLWIVNSSGGTAYRLTGMDGNERYPRFSPDGKWIAFSGTQDGNNNVYVMPVAGGEIKQLTFQESQDRVDSWSWDAKHIYFNSDRYNSFSGYKVSREGGTPQRLFGHYFNTVHGVVEHPVSSALYFTDTWESLWAAMRKGYKGDYNPDIKSYNPETKEYKVHTSYNGKDFWPTIDKQGNVYFVSDRYNGEYNLYRLKDGKKERLTSFKTSIKVPQVSANGEKITFEKDYQLFTYNVRDGKVRKVNINLFRNDTLKTEQDFNVNGKITYFAGSPDGKKFAFVSRGELFVSDIKGKFIRKLETAADGRVMEVKWLKDNKTLLFNQTVNGWQNLFKIRADKKEKEQQLTFDHGNNRNVSLNNEMSQALYLSGRNHIKVMDLKTFKAKTVVTDELWGFYNSQPYFSPDDRYIVFNAFRNFEEDVLVYNLKSGQTFNITDTGVTESDPFWSPDGKYLYFACDRSSPSYPSGGRDAKIYRLPLHKYLEPFKSTEWDKLFKEEDKNKDKDKNKKKTKKEDPAEKDKKETKKTDKKPVVTFDFDEMSRRWEQISPRPGRQSLPHVISKKEETIVLYLSNHDGESYNLWKTVLKPFESPETKKIKGAETYNPLVSTAKDKYYALVKGKIGEVDLKGNTFKPIKMSYPFRRNLRSEFYQMFFELWAGVEENFYDDQFHGVDWRKVKEKYQRFLPFIHSRSNLRELIRDMLGELNASHLGFGTSGDEEKTFHSLHSMQTGLLFDEQHPYTVKTVITDSPVDKKGIDIKPGDRLIAVNDKKVDSGVNREYFFAAPKREDELVLAFKRENEKTKEERVFNVKIHPASSFSVRRNLYDEWVRDNRQRVDKRSSKRIAYIHMKNMGRRELNNFIIEISTEAFKREGLILDLRYNTGGNVHDAVLNFLSRRPYTLWKYRGGKFAPQPHFAPAAKPIVLLINEQSLSDAEMTTAGFKALKLGKVIGTETYRWLIFTSGKSLVDGSYYRLPSWGCYTLDKEDIERTGVKPDIYIKNTFKDRLEGKDPQLDAAIDEIMKQLK